MFKVSIVTDNGIVVSESNFQVLDIAISSAVHLHQNYHLAVDVKDSEGNLLCSFFQRSE